MWAIPTGASWLLKKKKNQVKSPSPESLVPETDSDPPIGSDRDSGRDIGHQAKRIFRPQTLQASPRTPYDFENQAPTNS